MSEPISFASTTPRLQLPNLFPAQAQKELTINEAFALIDALVHAVVEGEADSPPPAPEDGECWIVGDNPSGEWALYPATLACRQAGVWLFAVPPKGMTAFDRSSGRAIRYLDGWQAAADVPPPAGGATVDSEARAAIDGVIGALRSAGILAAA